jgi:hypothetical protein
MKLEQQVCSLELAKRLKELGMKQESFLYWKRDPYGGSDDPYLVERNSRYMTSQGEIVASAFTVAELGEMLPIDLWFKERRYFLAIDVIGSAEKLWTIGFYNEGRTPSGHIENDPETKANSYAEADARAKMLIYLLENKLITL